LKEQSEMQGDQATNAAARPEAGVYQGKTSQGYDLSFRVTDGGEQVTAFASSLTVSCNGSTQTRPFLPPGSAALEDDGSFRLEISPGDGTTYTYAGRFREPGRAEGSLSLGSTKLVLGGLEVCVTPGIVLWEALLSR
jgi:hypothetical protein